MQKDRWQKIEEVFKQAVALPQAERQRFVEDICGADAELVREILELLEADTDEENFLDEQVFSLGVQCLNADDLLSTESDFAFYQIKKLLGRGGMGAVYLAEDTRLGRLVALKILPASLVENVEAVRRFRQEARAASAISHPNVAHIYEIGENGKMLFIAMEFVEGATLRELLRDQSPTVERAIDIALQTVSGLAAAHEKGIVHRDIKPENIIIRPDNLVKVVDFGIAKLTAADSPIYSDNRPQINDNRFAPDLVRTEPGILMGTVNYMSPEQVRGGDTDARTDLWSLGVVLYEMIVGEKPFQGETKSDVIASILRNEILDLPHNTPAELSTVIKKSLRKNVSDRYQCANDFGDDLKKIEYKILDYKISVNESTEENPSSRVTNENPDSRTIDDVNRQFAAFAARPQIDLNTSAERLFQRVKIHYRFVALSIGLMVLAVTASKFGMFNSRMFESGRQIESAEMIKKIDLKKLTNEGTAADEITAISPDGKYIVYVMQQGSLRSLWLKQVEAASNILIVAPAEVEYSSLNFSPDSNYIYYSVFSLNKESTEFYQIPVLGNGDALKLSDDVGDGHVSLSPDGSRTAFIRDARFLVIANLDGSQPQTISSASEGHVWIRPAWSPDGETIVLAASSLADPQMRLVEINVGDGSLKSLDGPPWHRISGIAWLPDKSGLIISGRDPETKLSQLWMLDYSTGKLRKITNDLDNYKAVSITADGKNLISVQQERVSNIYAVPNGDAQSARKITLTKGTDDGMSGVALTSDDRVVYTLNQNGTQDLWIVNRDGSNKRQLTHNLSFSASPAVSPDDRYVAFVTNLSGADNIWRLDLSDGRLKQLTFGSGNALYPDFSPDGESIFYQYIENNKSNIWKVGVDGDNPIPFIEKSSNKPVLSLDGKLIACGYKETPDSPDSIAVFSVDGAHLTQLIDSPSIVNSMNFRWSRDGKSLIYIDSRKGFYNLWSQPLSGDPPKQLTNFKSGQIFRFAQTRDGKEFVLAQAQESSDIVMISNFN